MLLILYLFFLVKKQLSLCNALDNLETSGNRIIMNESIDRTLIDLGDNFHVFFKTF